MPVHHLRARRKKKIKTYFFLFVTCLVLALLIFSCVRGCSVEIDRKTEIIKFF